MGDRESERLLTHVNSPDFGNSVDEEGNVFKIDFNKFIYDCLSPLPKVPITVGRLYMMERYETAYGIHDHDINPAEKEDSLAILGCWSAEKPNKYSYRQKRMREYIRYDVQKWMGLNYDEFLSRPRYILEEILDMCNQLQKEEADREQAKLRAMQEAQKEKRQQ